MSWVFIDNCRRKKQLVNNFYFKRYNYDTISWLGNSNEAMKWRNVDDALSFLQKKLQKNISTRVDLLKWMIKNDIDLEQF